MRVAPRSAVGEPVPCCDVGNRLTASAIAGVAVAALAGCGSGDSTVSKTPLASTTTTSASTSVESPSSQAAASSPPTPTPAPPDPCAVNLSAPAIARAVSELPRDPRSGQGWNPEPTAGNYNECAQLSAVIVRANTKLLNTGLHSDFTIDCDGEHFKCHKAVLASRLKYFESMFNMAEQGQRPRICREGSDRGRPHH